MPRNRWRYEKNGAEKIICLIILKRDYILAKCNFYKEKGVEDGNILPFDEEFYEKMSHTYISCLPVSIHMKYLKPIVGPGKCYDRSLYMFFLLS